MATTEARMGDVQGTNQRHRHYEEEKITTGRAVGGGSIAEAIGGIAAVVLPILALAGLLPLSLAAITAIVAGGALLLQGIAVAARYDSLTYGLAATDVQEIELGAGTGAEILGGAAGVVLGILALLGLDPAVLLSTAAITFGGALLLSSGTNVRLNRLVIERYYSHRREMARRILGDVVLAANSLQVLVALGAIVLGILGLLNAYSLTMSLIAFLAVGGAVSLSAGAVGGKLLTMAD